MSWDVLGWDVLECPGMSCNILELGFQKTLGCPCFHDILNVSVMLMDFEVSKCPCFQWGLKLLFLLYCFISFLKLPYSYINCVEAFMPNLIYEKILHDFGCTSIKTCTKMMDFIRFVKTSPKIESTNNTCYIVFDKAERLRKMDDHILSAFLRISELTGLNICVIFITEIILEKFFRTTGFYSPLKIHFDDYSKSDVVSIIELDCPDGYSKEFYSPYCRLVVDVFYMVCRDAKELRHLVCIICIF